MSKQLNKFMIILSLSLFSRYAMAFPCFITIVKDNCWTNYNVTVDVIDANTDKVLTTVVVPKGKPWVRSSFEATPRQQFMLRATFNPAFWKQDEGKQYFAKRYWALPEAVVGETTAWHVGACYPEQFLDVPMPPDAGSQCKCDKREIPEVQM